MDQESGSTFLGAFISESLARLWSGCQWGSSYPKTRLGEKVFPSSSCGCCQASSPRLLQARGVSSLPYGALQRVTGNLAAGFPEGKRKRAGAQIEVMVFM